MRSVLVRLLFLGAVSSISSASLIAAEPHGGSSGVIGSHGEYESKGSEEQGVEFKAPENDGPLSLNTSLAVDSDQSLVDSDYRFKARVDNAIAAKNEEELVKFVDMNLGRHYKRVVLLTLGEIYQGQGSPSRLIALYERFVKEFPNDKELPKLYLKLGRMYRDAGAVKTSLSKFYNVLNVALNVPVDELRDYQEVSHRAQLEIAETFFSMGSYSKAANFFKRLLRIDLVDEDHQMVLFKYAYTIYLSGDYEGSIPSLRNFINTFPESELAAEARYLISRAFTELNDPKSAMIETLELLTSKVGKIETNPETWLYWKKRTGNQLGNQFYQQGNYLDALKIYQAMVGLSKDLMWRWPVSYQIGLCYEKLEMKPKAIENYRSMIEESVGKEEEVKRDSTLASILEMATWRAERLEMDLDMEFSLQSLVNG